MYIYIYIDLRTYVYVYIYMYVYVYMYIYMYTHTYVHTYVHTCGPLALARAAARPTSVLRFWISIIYCYNQCRYSVVVRVLGWVCEGPRFHPGRCQLHGLGVRHFKVSGGVPSPPEQPQPNGRLSESKTSNKQDIVII